MLCTLKRFFQQIRRLTGRGAWERRAVSGAMPAERRLPQCGARQGVAAAITRLRSAG
ncbi:hypothetical protein BVIET440_170126 [Burkholderia vietnamiensis]